ncbi:MAG: thymidylate kinase [Terracidiphilus sp.]
MKVISFSGIDGAGKTTQIRNLCVRLNKEGLRFRLVAFWDDVARLTRFRESAGHTLFKGDKGVGHPSAPIDRKDKNVRSWPMAGVRLCIYLLDALSARAAFRRALRSNADVVIFDRFIYDELANLNLRNPLMRVYARLIAKLVPSPHIRYLIDADPIQARARKPEYPVDFLKVNRQSYLTLSELIGGMTIIAPMPLRQAEREVLMHAMRLNSAEDVEDGAESPPTGATFDDLVGDDLARMNGRQVRPVAP